MRFRPCIDIHNGTVKQIVGGSLKDKGDEAKTNFASQYDAAYYAGLYKQDGLKGGHVILLNPVDSAYYQQSKEQAQKALFTYPQGLQIGGGITAENAGEYIEAGASHVIVTSYVFRDGMIEWDCMKRLKEKVGKEHIVIDLSCRKKEDSYYIVTNRWQTFTEVKLTEKVLEDIAGYCDEFLVHGVDVEGKSSGMDKALVKMLSQYEGIPITYAGGIGTLGELEEFREVSGGRLDFTIGSALDLFGGSIPYEIVRNM